MLLRLSTVSEFFFILVWLSALLHYTDTREQLANGTSGRRRTRRSSSGSTRSSISTIIGYVALLWNLNARGYVSVGWMCRSQVVLTEMCVISRSTSSNTQPPLPPAPTSPTLSRTSHRRISSRSTQYSSPQLGKAVVRLPPAGPTRQDESPALRLGAFDLEKANLKEEMVRGQDREMARMGQEIARLREEMAQLSEEHEQSLARFLAERQQERKKLKGKGKGKAI